MADGSVTADGRSASDEFSRIGAQLRRAGVMTSIAKIQRVLRKEDCPLCALPRLPPPSAGQWDLYTRALIDLWNHTERPELDGRSPIEILRERALDPRGATESAILEEANFVLSSHNQRAVREFALPPDPRPRPSSIERLLSGDLSLRITALPSREPGPAG